MSTQQGQIISGTLPFGACWPDPQTYANTFAALAAVQFPGLTGIIISDTAPTANDQDKGWVKTSAGSPLWPPLFVYYNGHWVARHQIPPNDSSRILWVGLEADLALWDGGDANPAGAASGPMWVVDHTFDGRVPIGPGLLPGDTLTRTAVVATGLGEATHQLASTEVPSHTHLAVAVDTVGGSPLTSANQIAQGRTDDNYVLEGSGNPATVGKTSATGGDPNAGNATVAHNNVQPSYGCFFIKRTSRIFYLGA